MNIVEDILRLIKRTHCVFNRPSYLCTFCFPISDHVMPWWEFSFCFFISYAYICTCIRRHLKETIPSSSITWSEMRKQNIQAKEVYSFARALFLCYITNLKPIQKCERRDNLRINQRSFYQCTFYIGADK